MTNPIVFIVGCPRSGTTLFRHIVDAHPEIAITPEAHWIPKWFEERRGLTPEGLITPELIIQLAEYPKFALLRIGHEELLLLTGNGMPASYARFVTGIFDLYGQARGKNLVGNKTPDFVRRIWTLHELWPEARFVHLVRDGRDVALSLMNWPRVRTKKPGTFVTWLDDPVSTAALWWELNVRCGLKAREWLGPSLYYEMRYETLVGSPAAECRALCGFLGLPYDERMLRFHEDRAAGKSGTGTGRDWGPITPGLRDWRSQMAAEDVERFEAAAGGLLDELGYTRAFPHPRAERIEAASRIREVLSQYPVWSGR